MINIRKNRGNYNLTGKFTQRIIIQQFFPTISNNFKGALMQLFQWVTKKNLLKQKKRNHRVTRRCRWSMVVHTCSPSNESRKMFKFKASLNYTARHHLRNNRRWGLWEATSSSRWVYTSAHTGITKWTPWVLKREYMESGGEVMRTGDGLERRKGETHLIKTHYVHVWNYQTMEGLKGERTHGGNIGRRGGEVNWGKVKN